MKSYRFLPRMKRADSDIQAMVLAILVQTVLLLLTESQMLSLHQELRIHEQTHSFGAAVRTLLFAAYMSMSLCGLAVYQLTCPKQTQNPGIHS